MYSRNIKLEIITLMQSCVPEASIYLYSLYLILNYTHFHCITLPLLPKYLHTNFQTWPSLFSHPSSGASSFTALCPTRNWDRSTRSVVVLHSLMFSERLHIFRPRGLILHLAPAPFLPRGAQHSFVFLLGYEASGLVHHLPGLLGLSSPSHSSNPSVLMITNFHYT